MRSDRPMRRTLTSRARPRLPAGNRPRRSPGRGDWQGAAHDPSCRGLHLVGGRRRGRRATTIQALRRLPEDVGGMTSLVVAEDAGLTDGNADTVLIADFPTSRRSTGTRRTRCTWRSSPSTCARGSPAAAPSSTRSDRPIRPQRSTRDAVHSSSRADHPRRRIRRGPGPFRHGSPDRLWRGGTDTFAADAVPSRRGPHPGGEILPTCLRAAAGQRCSARGRRGLSAGQLRGAGIAAGAATSSHAEECACRGAEHHSRWRRLVDEAAARFAGSAISRP